MFKSSGMRGVWSRKWQLKTHSDKLLCLRAAVADSCSVAKNRKSSNFLHRTCLPHPHLENAAGLNVPYWSNTEHIRVGSGMETVHTNETKEMEDGHLKKSFT